MKKLILPAFMMTLSFISWQALAGNIDLNSGHGSGLRILENTDRILTVESTLDGLQTIEVITDKGTFTQLLAAGYTKSDLVGYPDLPVMRRLIEVPLGADLEVEVLESSYTDLDLYALGITHPIIPAQPPVAKNQQNVRLVYDPAAYTTDDFYPSSRADAEALGIMRNVRVGRLDIRPVSYNPVTHILRVYHRLVIRVSFPGADIPATLALKQKYQDMYFRNSARKLMNYREEDSRDTGTRNPISFVIVSDRMFEAQLQPFIEWKTKKGFKVIVGYTDEPNVGSTTYSIKSYLQGLFNTEDPAPTFVLFVGDIAQIPAWTGNAGSHVTDLYYCEYTSDLLPEMYYGRFSAYTTSQLQPQIDKTLMYEQYLMPDPSYLNEVVMIAGMDANYGPIHANGQILYGTENYFNETNGIFSHTYLYPESGSMDAQIRSDINDGVCFANYTAHGSPSGWGDPEFLISHISDMDNYGKYALLVGNCCLSSKYDVECFGEALLRAEDKGAVAYIGASNNTYWDEDYYWGVGNRTIAGDPPPYEPTHFGAYDRTFHTHGEPYEDWYMTTDQMVYAGNLAVMEGAPSSATYYWEVYCVMGDPSLMVYYAVPPDIEASHLPLIPLGTTTFVIDTDPYAYIGISMDGELYGAGQADPAGHAEIELIPMTQPGFSDIIITKQNGRPYITSIPAANPEGAFVVVSTASITELSGFVNNKLEPGEIAAINLDLMNYGNSDGSSIIATLATEDDYITIADDTEDCGTVPAQSHLIVTNAFSIIVDDSIPDGHMVDFTVTLQDATRETWISEISFSLYAPILKMVSMSIDDSEGGNGNGILEPGESADIAAIFGNGGHAVARNTTASLEVCSGFITVDNPVVSIGNLNFFGNTPIDFHVSADTKATVGILANLNIGLTSGAYSFSETCPIRLGLISEDFETGDFSSFEWSAVGNAPWTITSIYPFDGVFSAKSGTITDGQSTGISLTYAVGIADSISFFRKVSSGSGDILKFYIDNQVLGEWSGTTTSWKRQAYAVSPGNHTFKWIYSKDGSGSSGSDAAWLDNILFPAPVAINFYAGPDGLVCGPEDFTPAAFAVSFNSIEWGTSGDGSFNDITLVSPVYTPGSQDMLNGTVNLTMNLTDDEDGSYNDLVILTIDQLPEAPVMPFGPAEVDLEEVYVSTYSTEVMPGCTSYNWTVMPAEAGVLVGSGNEVTMLWDRLFAGTATLTVAAVNHCGEGLTSPGFEVEVINNAVGMTEPPARTFEIGLYPNPADEITWIVVRGGESGAKIGLELFNLTGSLMKAWEGLPGASGVQVPVRVNDLPAGIYFLRVESNGQILVQKLVIR